MHMIGKAQMTLASCEGMSLAEPFDALSRKVVPLKDARTSIG